MADHPGVRRARVVSPAASARALFLLRRGARSSAILALVAGLVAAVPIALTAAGRRASTAVDQFAARAGAPDLSVELCPPGLDPEAQGDISACIRYEPRREVAAIRDLQGVTRAATSSYAAFLLGSTPDLADSSPAAMVQLDEDFDVPTASGSPVVVAGRLAAADAPDELMLTETLANALGIDAGDEVWVAGFVESADEAGEAPAPEPFASTVVGVVRTLPGLLPDDGGGLDPFTPHVFARGGWTEAHQTQVPTSGNSVSVWLADGDVDAFLGRLGEALPRQAFHPSPGLDPALRSTLTQATRYESSAALAIAAIAALAALFFVGQIVRRQSREEAADDAVLLALGMSRRDLRHAALVRSLPPAAGATAIGVAASLAASSLGPVGVARRGPWDRGVHVDVPVVSAGAAAVFLLIVVASQAGQVPRAARARQRHGAIPTSSPAVRVGASVVRGVLHPGAALPTLSAAVGIAIGSAVMIAASGGLANLDHILSDSARFGAPWDAFVGNPETGEDTAAIAASISDLRGVSAAALNPGSPLSVNGKELWAQALVPIAGVDPVEPPIIEGRAPAAADEIALGTVAMRRSSARLGDEVVVDSAVAGRSGTTFRVVGVAMVNDGIEPHVGIGALLSPAGMDRVAPEAVGGAVVTAQAGSGRADALDAVREAFGDAYRPVVAPMSLRNAERISALPRYLGVGTAVLAGVSLLQALSLMVRRHRRQLAVCRVLGFTRRQVYGALLVATTSLTMVASAAGVLLGLILLWRGWEILARGLGVSGAGAGVPALAALATAAGLLVVANAVVGALGMRASARRPGDVLRSAE